MSELAITTSTNLAHPDARRTALAKLNQAAEQATDPGEARRIMLQAKAIAEILESAKAPFEEARLAGKASVIAGRKVGRFLEEADPKPMYVRGQGGRGSRKSERGLLLAELGIGHAVSQNLRRLARLEDGHFQRYIQLTDRIPSIHGCLVSTYPRNYRKYEGQGDWRRVRRRSVGVKSPRNASLEEGHSLVIRALGHVSESIRKEAPGKVQQDISAAIDHLYAAEDLLRPHLGGYTSSRVKKP